MKKSLAAILLFITLLLTACTGADEQEESTESFFAMDTHITFTAYGKNAQSALSEAKGLVEDLERQWSVTDTGSEIYAVNHSGGQPVTVSHDTADLITFALEMAERTSGALEPTIYPVLTAWGFTTDENRIPPEDEIREKLLKVGYDRVELTGDTVQLPNGMMLDLGAVGKGRAGDMVIDLLKQQGVTSALLDIGGNIQTLGTKPDGTDWRLGIRDPFGEGYLGVLTVHDKAVVTSGSYERYFIGEDGVQYGHIIDPSTGRSVESGLASVAVIAEEGKLCDALSTALFVMGADKAIDYWRQSGGFEMILVTESGEIHLTEGVEESFTLSESYQGIQVKVIYNEE